MEPMETEAAGEENARGNNDDAAATKEEASADDPAGEEAANAAAAEAGEGSGDRTDGPEAAGAPGNCTDRRSLRRCRGARLRRALALRLLEGRRRHLHQASLGVKFQGAGRRRSL